MIKLYLQKWMGPRLNSKGVSMAEVLITVLLFTILMGICLELLITGSDSWTVNRNRAELQQELRKAVDWIKEDLRESGASGVTNVLANGSVYTTITFRKATGASNGVVTWSNPIVYQLGGTGGTQLLRTLNGTSRVISQHITVLQFSRASTSSDIVNVSLTVSRSLGKGGTISLSYSFKVKMRNS